jgi:hypothetical protein
VSVATAVTELIVPAWVVKFCFTHGTIAKIKTTKNPKILAKREPFSFIFPPFFISPYSIYLIFSRFEKVVNPNSIQNSKSIIHNLNYKLQFYLLPFIVKILAAIIFLSSLHSRIKP